VDAETELERPYLPAPERSPPPPWLLPLAALLVGATLLGSALSPYLAINHPLLLLLLNPLPRHLILVAPYTEFAPFLAVASLRGLLACAVAYELGRHYGEGDDSFLAQRFPNGIRNLRSLSRVLGRLTPLLLLVMPGMLTSVFAGMSGVRRALAYALSLAGLLAWASLNHRLGGYLAPYIEPIMRFFAQNMLLATLLCTALVLLYHFSSRRRGG
jgi:membrane protein DedA with SNARE-associated domain